MPDESSAQKTSTIKLKEGENSFTFKSDETSKPATAKLVGFGVVEAGDDLLVKYQIDGEDQVSEMPLLKLAAKNIKNLNGKAAEFRFSDENYDDWTYGGVFESPANKVEVRLYKSDPAENLLAPRTMSADDFLNHNSKMYSE